MAGEQHAADTLEAYLDVFTNHYMNAKHSVPPDWGDGAHLRLRELGVETGESKSAENLVPTHRHP
jgi:hypothetical protein